MGCADILHIWYSSFALLWFIGCVWLPANGNISFLLRSIKLNCETVLTVFVVDVAPLLNHLCTCRKSFLPSQDYRIFNGAANAGKTK
ncbi:hypothetical protein FRX31_032655, partial [Thalictrum thalictroides]